MTAWRTVIAATLLIWCGVYAHVAMVHVGIAAAQQAPPLLTAPVNDFAGVIDTATEQELDRRIRALQQATGDVIVVATVRSFDPFGSIEEYAVRMFENGGRGIGEKGRDNGALVLLALEERQARIEVGYDLEEFITDGYAGETIRQVMAPELRTGAYGRGLLAGTTRLIHRIAERRGVVIDDVPSGRQPVQPPTAFNVWPILFLVWLLVIMASSRRRRRRQRRWGGGHWSGWDSGVGPFGGGGFGTGGFGGGFGGFGGGGRGGSGGGFGGFGGGRSGGGGATGGW